MLKHIDLQLFADDTNPDVDEDMFLEDSQKKDEKDGKPEENGKKPAKKEKDSDPFRKLFDKQYDSEGTVTKKPDEKKPDEKKPEKADKKKPDETEVSETKKPEEGQDEDFYEVIHLGKKVRIPKAERDAYLQMGVDYKHLKDEHSKNKALLQRIAELEGFKAVDESFTTEIDKRLKAKLAEQIEEAAGDPTKIDEAMENHPKVKSAKEKEREVEEEKQKIGRDKKIESLKSKEFFQELKPELDRILTEQPTADPVVAYTFLVGNYLLTGKLKELKKQTDEEIKKAREAAVKTTIADMHDKEKRAAPTGGDTGEGKETAHPTAFTQKLASVFGVSASKIAQRSHEKMKGS